MMAESIEEQISISSEPLWKTYPLAQVTKDANLSQPITLKFLLLDFWDEIGDKRTKHYLLNRYGPLPIMTLMFVYLSFCTIIGPRLMRHREPFNLRKVIMIYNIIMVILNARNTLMIIYYLNWGKDLFKEDLFNLQRENWSPFIKWQLDQINFAYYIKLGDLLDTIFFVLRKKQNHLSKLHLYHHFIVPFLGWPFFRMAPLFYPFGIVGIVNSFVHTIMYFYYFLAAWGPQMQPYLWWKKYLTQLQIAQFAIYLVYAVYVGIAYHPPAPSWLYFAFYSHAMLFFWLFYNFYRHAYVQKKPTNLSTHKKHDEICNCNEKTCKVCQNYNPMNYYKPINGSQSFCFNTNYGSSWYDQNNNSREQERKKSN